MCIICIYTIKGINIENFYYPFWRYCNQARSSDLILVSKTDSRQKIAGLHVNLILTNTSCSDGLRWWLLVPLRPIVHCSVQLNQNQWKLLTSNLEVHSALIRASLICMISGIRNRSVCFCQRVQQESTHLLFYINKSHPLQQISFAAQRIFMKLSANIIVIAK